MIQSSTRSTIFAAFALSLAISAPAFAQLGQQQGLVEPHVASDSTLLSLPGVNADVLQALKAARPILSASTLDSILGSKSLSRQQRTDLYGKMFVHVDVNRGTDAELMLIPGVDANKLRVIKTGRPWKTFDQFRTEVAKTTSAAEAMRLEKYLFIPIDLNTFTDPIMDTFASIGVGTTRWKHEFDEYRPWKSYEQFDREIGKYVRQNPTELQRLKRYVIINP